jgi:hypothetical protein
MGENDGTRTTTQVRQRPVCLSGQAESRLPIDFCSPVMTLLRDCMRTCSLALKRAVLYRSNPNSARVQFGDADYLRHRRVDWRPVSNYLMEASQGDYRRIGLSVAGLFILLAVVGAIGFIARPKMRLEWEQAHAEVMNPRWLSVEITTADNRREYRKGEPIFVIARFSSAVRYKYKIEVAEAESKSAVDLLHISNGQQVPLNREGIVCCDSRLIGLDDQPYSPRTLTPLQLAPGKYEIYLTSWRVFKWDAGPKEYSPSSFQVASNVLKIRVVPDAGKMRGDAR